MTQYELPDGFQRMESLPKENVKVNILYIDGDICPNMTDYLREAGENPGRIGWAPIVQLKKKARFVVSDNCFYGPWAVYDNLKQMYVAHSLPTRDAAQRIADIYNEVMP